MKNKVKLYHYSNRDIKDTITPNNFGENCYTFNDKKISNIKRVFYYLGNSQVEWRFKSCQYKYTVEIDKSKLYDLRIDKKRYIKKYKSIDRLLWNIKKQYDGTIYNIGGLNIAIAFKDLKVVSKTKVGF